MFGKVEDEIDRLYHPYNICAEIVDQYVSALVGKPFSWALKRESFDESAAQEKIRTEAEALIGKWFSWQTEVAIDTDLGDPIANAITQMLVRDQGDGAGVGYLRLYSPEIYNGLEEYQQVIFHHVQKMKLLLQQRKVDQLRKVLSNGIKEI